MTESLSTFSVFEVCPPERRPKGKGKGKEKVNHNEIFKKKLFPTLSIIFLSNINYVVMAIHVINKSKFFFRSVTVIHYSITVLIEDS